MPVQIAYIVVYLILAFFAARWNRGVLPVGARRSRCCSRSSRSSPAPAWFNRDKSGFEQPGAQRGPARADHAADRARADAARGVRDARLQPGLERGARAPRPGAAPAPEARGRPRARTPPDTRRRAAGYPRLGRHDCGGGGTVDAGPSKGPVRKGVWVRLPPAASIDRTGSGAADELAAAARPASGAATRIPHGRFSWTGSSSTARPARSQTSAPAAMSHCLTVRSK